MVRMTPGSLFALALGIYFLATLIPSALSTFFDANTSGWSASSVALWALIPLAIVAAVVLVFIPRGRGGE